MHSTVENANTKKRVFTLKSHQSSIGPGTPVTAICSKDVMCRKDRLSGFEVEARKGKKEGISVKRATCYDVCELMGRSYSLMPETWMSF